MGSDDLLARVVMHGYAYEYRNRQTGEVQYLDPTEVTVVLPKSQADEYPHTWEARALKAEDRIAELERQRDAVLALHKHRENRIVCVYDDEIWPCQTAAALGVREDEYGRPLDGGGR